MASDSNSLRLLKMKINRPQNIDASYATMYDEEEEDANYEDEIEYDDEEDQDEEDYEEESDEMPEQEDMTDITVEEALPPPPTLIEEEGEMAAKELIIDEEIGGENELDTSSTSPSNNDTNDGFKYVQGMPSPSESWSDRVSNFNESGKMKTLPESVLPPQQVLSQKQKAMVQFDKNENNLEVVAEEEGDDLDQETISAEGERPGGEEDEEDNKEVEDDQEEIRKEGDNNKEEEGDVEEVMVEEEVEYDSNEEKQQHEQEDDPEGEAENEQQQDIEEVEAATSNAPDVTTVLDSRCKATKWHPNKEFNQCSNSLDIPQAGVEDETFQKMFFFDALVECCQKFFHADECDNEDVCADLNEEEKVGGIAFERQADGELEDEVPDDEGEPEKNAGEDDTDEEVASEDEEVDNEDEEESDESNNKSSSTEGQGVQIDETNEKTNWEGFDEDMSPQSIKHEPEQPSSSVKAHDVSEAQGKNDYEGDGFGTTKFKLLRGKGKGGTSSANPSTVVGSGAWVAAILLILSCCLCYLRYRRRRYAQSKRPNRGNYAALGRHDFFNGTFSDDVSYGKDSDDDISIESYGSDDGGHQTSLEMGGLHELDANGGLTLEEING
ncbi:hypothetical protein ACHAWT_001911 [Skeletonema menzelii]